MDTSYYIIWKQCPSPMLPGISPTAPELAAVDVLEQVTIYIYIHIYSYVNMVCISLSLRIYIYIHTYIYI